MKKFEAHYAMKKASRRDFTDPTEVRDVTKEGLAALGIALDLPNDALCPPVPNRLNYIHWLSSLLQPCSLHTHVLDIGVGSSCIYPLLGRREYGWHFTGCDIDATAIEWAARNVALNASAHPGDIALVLVPTTACKLQGALASLVVKHQKEENEEGEGGDATATTVRLCEHMNALEWREASLRGPARHALAAMGSVCARRLLACEQQHDDSATLLLSAVMCNPPFYDTDEHIAENPRTVCTGKPSEMRTPGGEVAFVLALIMDSLVVGAAVEWFTCLLGKKKSLIVLVPILRRLNFPAVRSTRFEQGRTHRWGLAWSLRHSDAGAVCSTNPRAFKTRPSGGPPIEHHVAREIVIAAQDPPLVVDTIQGRIGQSLQTQKIDMGTLALTVEVNDATGSATIFLTGATALPLLEVDALCGRLKSDVERTGRRWRRSGSSNKTF